MGLGLPFGILAIVGLVLLIWHTHRQQKQIRELQEGITAQGRPGYYTGLEIRMHNDHQQLSQPGLGELQGSDRWPSGLSARREGNE